MIEALTNALEARRLTVESVAGTLNVSQGKGIMAHKTNLDPAEFFSTLEDKDPAQRARKIAGYANGVKTVLLEPKRSDARNWSFVESAGSLLPTLEVDSFVDGVRDACGEPAWAQPLADDVIIAWQMRLNRGLRPVTAPQFDDWGVTKDRVVSAGRSLLFHRTRGQAWATLDGHEDVQIMRVGDGHDAARMLVAEDVFFCDIDRQWRFAIPQPDVLLAVSTEAAVGALEAAAHDLFDDAEYPLSRDIWQLTKAGASKATA